MTKMKRGFIEIVIRAAAEGASESTSLFCLHEPKMPEKLIKSDLKNNKNKK